MARQLYRFTPSRVYAVICHDLPVGTLVHKARPQDRPHGALRGLPRPWTYVTVADTGQLTLVPAATLTRV